MNVSRRTCPADDAVDAATAPRSVSFFGRQVGSRTPKKWRAPGLGLMWLAAGMVAVR